MHLEPQILLVFECDVMIIYIQMQCSLSLQHIVCSCTFSPSFLISHVRRKLFTVFTALTWAKRCLSRIQFIVTTSCLLGGTLRRRKKTQRLSHHMISKVQSTDVYMYGKGSFSTPAATLGAVSVPLDALKQTAKRK